MNPGPGVYPDVPADQYHSWDAASNSRLKVLGAKSPAHLLAHIQRPVDTKALRAGRAIHMAVLEPDLFASQYVMAGPCTAELASGKRKGEPCGNTGLALHRTRGWLCGQHVGGLDDFDTTRLVLPADDYAAALGIRDSAYRLKSVRSALTGTTVELSVLWHESETGVLTKARWDAFSPELPGGAILDLKSTEDASRKNFERDIYRYRYHVQGGLYTDSAKVRRLPAKHYVIIAAEKKYPYAVATYRLDEGALDAGHEQAKPLLRLYQQCMESGEWPGYPDEFQDVSLPAYSWAQIDDEIKESVQ